ncbi:MAG: prolipoprotein diacylglyceryl transferase [Treponema sp.]|nr:prolipoprotein diacylglyceryl transferase [Treponema sp.]
MLLVVNFPSWLKPEIIPGLPFRWYGLMYLVAFSIAYMLYRVQIKERNFPMKDDELSGLFFWGILSLILGARIFATLVYETSPIYRREPWLILWPFQKGRFIGLSGMSYHGGVIGGALAILIYSARRRFDYREIGDMYAASIPLGYTFGRLGNFINAELYGRVTAGPLGMIFPNAELSVKEEWVRNLAEKTGITEASGYVNLPRHPSQLYEALFEGIVLWLIIWFLRNKKPFKGFLVGIYLVGYGFFRFVIEYFREPDASLGYRITLVKTDLPPAIFSSLFNFSTGQVFCFIMILLGLAWIFAASRLPDRIPVRIYPTKEEEERRHRRNRRKLKKR